MCSARDIGTERKRIEWSEAGTPRKLQYVTEITPVSAAIEQVQGGVIPDQRLGVRFETNSAMTPILSLKILRQTMCKKTPVLNGGSP
jgi:hypothetical protein